jgi:predicted lipid-binding transport protein (Tim44 family)
MSMKWLLIILALVYLLSPYDLIPGFHGLGWLDDIVILVLVYRYLSKIKLKPDSATGPSGTHQDQQHARNAHDTGSGAEQPPRRTPHEILNLPPDADQEAIKAAYRKLANQYHPDKVSHLGKEFQDLAEQRFKEIQEAYQKLEGN